MKVHFLRRAVVASAATAFAAGASVLFGGVANAGGLDHAGWGGWGGHDHGWHHGTHGTGGNGGNGGAANANCAVPIGISAGIIGQGGDVSQCNATGGAGGAGGDGIN
ncbi:MAG TPA: hypothetical protein VGH89_17565 [Pseudonocardia sp.]|jgi:hypothetical protein